MSSYEPLKIIFYLRSPLILGWRWIHFDGLIAHVLLRRELGERYYLLPSKRSASDVILPILDEKMPVLKTMHNGFEIWHASVSMINDMVIDGVTIYKKFEAKRIHLTTSRKKRVEIRRAYYKSFAMRVPLIPCREVVFYVCGVEDEVSELVSYIPAIGKKRVYGFGDIKGYDVIKVEEDYSLFKGNIVMRPIPLEAFKRIMTRRVKVANVAYKPPYWWKANTRKCVLPGSVLEGYEL